jgi:hypothetical protein
MPQNCSNSDFLQLHGCPNNCLFILRAQHSNSKTEWAQQFEDRMGTAKRPIHPSTFNSQQASVAAAVILYTFDISITTTTKH